MEKYVSFYIFTTVKWERKVEDYTCPSPFSNSFTTLLDEKIVTDVSEGSGVVGGCGVGSFSCCSSKVIVCCCFWDGISLCCPDWSWTCGVKRSSSLSLPVPGNTGAHHHAWQEIIFETKTGSSNKWAPAF